MPYCPPLKYNIAQVSFEPDGEDILAYVPIGWLLDPDYSESDLDEFIKHERLPSQCGADVSGEYLEGPYTRNGNPEGEDLDRWDNFTLKIYPDPNYTCHDVQGAWLMPGVKLPKQEDGFGVVIFWPSTNQHLIVNHFEAAPSDYPCMVIAMRPSETERRVEA